jgi:tetratricopeptide (TPR) repeat protein
VGQEAIVFTAGLSDEALARQRLAEHMAQFFEEKWIHSPLKALNRIAPIDAAGHRNLRKKLIGVIQFLEDCGAAGPLQLYDFNRLRRKLGLAGAAPTGGESGPLDFSTMGAAELGAVSAQGLTEEQLEQAHRAAVKLDAHELGRNFARELVSRPGDEARPDRSPWYFYLMDRAVAEGNTDLAMDYVNEGERVDCEQNQGRRTADFEVRRARLHAKRGEADLAHEVFERLLQRDPSNQKTRAAATEAMLSLRQGARALKFAEEGLARARQQNDRDSEQHFEELAAAAKKQGGS